MPASPPHVIAPGPGLEASAPKPRSSCDGCGIAKVKCNRGHPECGRCATLSLTCVYGPSRKFGKPPRKRPGSDVARITEKRICTPWTVKSRDDHTTTGFGEPQRFNEPAQANSPAQGANNFQFSCDIDAALGINEAFDAPLSLDEWLQLDGFGAGLEIPSASALEPVSTLSTSFNSHESHSCPRDSYEIFRDLICPSPSLHAPESNSVMVSAHLDQVLHFNRNAMNRLGRVLTCPCAKSGHRAMVHASIVSRILIWYQQAAGWTCRAYSLSSSSSSPPSPSETVAGTDTTSGPSLAQATGFAVEHVPVSIGTFSIEDQNVQAVLRNQLILSELKKMANLIDIFISQDSSEASTNGMGGLYSHLGTWLRSEHSRTVKILRSRLSTLNKNLES